MEQEAVYLQCNESQWKLRIESLNKPKWQDSRDHTTHYSVQDFPVYILTTVHFAQLRFEAELKTYLILYGQVTAKSD